MAKESRDGIEGSRSMKKALTPQRLRQLLDYDPQTGIFRWKVSRGRFARPGGIAGTDSHAGYMVITVDRNRVYAHRLAWFYAHGEWPEYIDHINHNPSDNRLCNLRAVDNPQNMHNLNGPPRHNTSGVIGVSRHSTNMAWVAEIWVRGKKKYLGSFRDFDEAVAARKSAEVCYYEEMLL
jgi:hypothetical protein